jgi:Cd2+/Zn2+-exporting ATPase
MAIQTIEIPLGSTKDASCGPCLLEALRKERGIHKIHAVERTSHLQISFDDTILSFPNVQHLITQLRSELAQTVHHETLTLMGLDCADCAATLERGIGRLKGLIHVQANFATSKMNVGYQAAALDHQQLEKCIQELGYKVLTIPASAPLPVQSSLCSTTCSCTSSTSTTQEQSPGESTAEVFRPSLLSFVQRYSRELPTAIAACFWVLAFTLEQLHTPSMLITASYIIAILIGGYRIARSAYYGLIRGRSFGIDLLMTVAVVGAGLLGDWAEGAAVVVLFSLGQLLEGLTMDRVRHSLRGLLDLTPRVATLKTAAGERQVPVEQLQEGDFLVIRPGERIAADGKVVQGTSSVNQAPITGESLPVEKQHGDEVFAGTMNEHGFLEIEVTRKAQDTTLAKIITLVQEAQGSRAPLQRFVERFARYYTPAILIMAILVALLPPLVTGTAFAPWLYKALVLLVIACPCALVISTPVAIVAAIGRASRTGILIKGGAYLEALATVRGIVFDKTGTLTGGRPAVTDIVPLINISPDDLLRLAASAESRSEHPLAKAVLQAAEAKHLCWTAPTTFQALPGRGIQATVENTGVAIGSPGLFTNLDAPAQAIIDRLQQEGKTVLLIAQTNTLAGILGITDQARPEAAQALKQLRATGVTSLVMLTGDNEHSAQAIAGQLGIEDVRANLLPEQKMKALKTIQAEQKSVAMVGDGINDAPALASATVGIAMGTAGSDTAIETADIALVTDDLLKLPFAIKLSRTTLRTIKTNITFSLVTKALFLVLTLVGIASLWLAILADTGAALVVILYSMRLLHFKGRYL